MAHDVRRFYIIRLQPLVFQLADPKVALAQRLIIAGLVIITVYHIDEVMKAAGGTGYLPIPNPMIRGALFGIPALVLSVASFAFAWNKPTIIVSLFLLITGTLMTADGIAIGTRNLSVLSIPGPIIGLFYGLAVLSLGVAKAIQTARALKTLPERR
jgi:Ca2+/Na+ antiporter